MTTSNTQVMQWAMVSVGALLMVAAFLVHSRGQWEKRREKGNPAKKQRVTQTEMQQQTELSKQSRRAFWRPNVAHVSRNLSPAANASTIHDAARNLRARRFSVA